MEFNSVKSAAKNVQAAVPTVNAMSGIFDTARKTSANVTKIATTAIKSRARIQQAAMKAEGGVARTGMAQTALNKQVEKRNENFMKNVDHAVKENRKAGILGMFQSAATGAIMGIDRRATEKERAARNARETASMENMIEAMNKPGPEFDYSILDQLNNNLPKPPNPNDPKYTYKPGQQSSAAPGTPAASSPTAPGGSQNMTFSPPQNGGGSNTSTSSLTGYWKTIADGVAQYESGQWGYDAFNQSGSKGGNSNDGTGGSYQQKFGKNLTNMTIAEVMDLQSGNHDWNKYPTMDSWYKAGKIHAAGRYQFIGDTLKGVVARSGIDVSRKFDASAQDELFKFHATEVGGLQPWVGAKHLGSQKLSEYNSFIRNQ